MNPYLEQDDAWHDFHKSFMPAMSEALVSQVRPKKIVMLVRSTGSELLCCVEIRDRETRETITRIELLDPSHKRPGLDRELYLSMRSEILQSSVHFVELDLLRGGIRLPFKDLPGCDYYALVSRADQRPRSEVWPLTLRDALPMIPVPRRAPDPDARLNLRAILDRVYDAAGYEDYIYRGAPEPPLYPEDAAWAQQFVPKEPL